MKKVKNNISKNIQIVIGIIGFFCFFFGLQNMGEKSSSVLPIILTGTGALLILAIILFNFLQPKGEKRIE